MSNNIKQGFDNPDDFKSLLNIATKNNNNNLSVAKGEAILHQLTEADKSFFKTPMKIKVAKNEILGVIKEEIAENLLDNILSGNDIAKSYKVLERHHKNQISLFIGTIKHLRQKNSKEVACKGWPHWADKTVPFTLNKVKKFKDWSIEDKDFYMVYFAALIKFNVYKSVRTKAFDRAKRIYFNSGVVKFNEVEELIKFHGTTNYDEMIKEYIEEIRTGQEEVYKVIQLEIEDISKAIDRTFAYIDKSTENNVFLSMYMSNNRDEDLSDDKMEIEAIEDEEEELNKEVITENMKSGKTYKSNLKLLPLQFLKRYELLLVKVKEDKIKEEAAMSQKKRK